MMKNDSKSNESVKKTGEVPFYQTWMTVVYDEELNTVDIINPQHSMLLQLDAESLLNTNLSELEKIIDESNRKSAEIIVRNIHKAWEENRNVYFEYTTTQQDCTLTYSICYAEKRPNGLLYVNVIKIDEENIFEARDGFTNYILDSTMNNVSVGVCMRQIYENGTWKYILFNDVVKEFYECDEVLHSPYWNQEEDDLADQKAMQLDEPLKQERIIRNGQGDVKRWLVITKKKIANRVKGHYIVTTFIDITRRRQNEIILGKQFSLLDSMYRCLPEAIIIYNEEGKLISLNDKGMELFGVTDRELVMSTNLFLDPNTTSESKEALKRGEDVNYEVEYDFDLVADKYIYTSHKGKRVFRVKAAPIRSEEGILNGYLEVYEDITEQRVVEDALAKKHRLLETVFENVPVGLEIYDKEGRLTDINKQELDNLGIESVIAFLGTKLEENPNLSEDVKARIRRKENFAITMDYDFQLAERIIGDTAHTGHHYFRILSTPINGADGSHEGYLFVNQDVTEQVKREQLLVGTVAKFSTVFNCMACGIEIYNRDGELIDCNPYDLEILGIDHKEDFLGAGITLFNNPNVEIVDRELLGSERELIKNVDYSFDIVRSTGYYPTRKTGSINLEIKINSVFSEGGDFLGFVVVMNNTTELRHRERQLEQTQNNLTMALEASNMSVWRYKKHERLFITILGNTLSGMGMTMEENNRRIHPEDMVKQQALFRDIFEGRKTKGEIVCRYMSDDVSEGYRYYESQMIGVKNDAGETLYINGTQKDVTSEYLRLQLQQLQQRKLEFIIQNSDIIIWEFNVETQMFTAYNDPINGYDNSVQLTMEEYYECLHPEDRKRAAEFLNGMLVGKDIFHCFDARLLVAAETEWRYCTISGLPFIRKEDGSVAKYVGYRRDNTRWKLVNDQLREKNLQLDMALKAGNIVPITWEIDSEMVYISSPEIKKKYSVFETAQNGLPIEVLLNYVHPDDRERVQRIFTDIRSERRTAITEQFRYDINCEFKEYFEANFIVVKDETENYHQVFGYMQNITERKKLLEDLQQAKELAEQSDKLKSAFLANMSHEIRTPLNAIVGFSSLLTETSDSEEQAEYVRIITLNNDLLLRLISDILDLSKIEAGVIERSPERIDIASISQDIYTVMQAKLGNADVELRLESPYQECWMELDPHRLRQVWNNFLTNAMKHTKHGHITMGYNYTGSAVRLYVEDTGAGIRFELQDRLFGRFQKLNEFEQGTGLGLAICKAIVEAAKGTVGFTSKEGEGSTFWIEIPCEAQIVEKGSASVAVFPAISPNTMDTEQHVFANASESVEQEKRVQFIPHILVAEDNDSNYLLVEHLLKAYHLTRAYNGVQVVELESKGHFDLVLMDMKMPLMGGLEATRNIRKRNAGLPIVALTANAFDSDRLAAIDAGCNGFIVKPLKRKELMKIIGKYCNRINE